MWLTYCSLLLQSLSFTVILNKVNTASLPTNSERIHKDTILVLWGTRHGNRQPEHFLEQNPRTFGYEGELELSKYGKVQALNLGKELRKFVGKDFVNQNYLPKEAKYFSSSASRCQCTLQAAVAGFYSPNAWGQWDQNSFKDWSPVPYSIDDPLLRMYAVEDCPASDKAWKPISDDTWPPLAKTRVLKKNLLNYIHNQTGWEPTISVAADVADNLIEMDKFKSKYPDWIEKPTLPGYDKNKLVKELKEFAESHQIACATYAPCRGVMSGYWVKHIFDMIELAKKGKAPKIVGYASHTEIILSLMKLIGYKRDEMPTSAGFVIEFKRNPDAVRLLSHDPTGSEKQKHVIYKAKVDNQLERAMDKDGFIPLAKFERLVGPNRITNWKKACGQQPAPCSDEPTPSPAVAEFIAPPPAHTSTEPSQILAECDETDDAGNWRCESWADYGYCETHRATKYLHCRRTCLCNPKYGHDHRHAHPFN